jgi:alpha-tubulin suppressor-like RCC1 family protein
LRIAIYRGARAPMVPPSGRRRKHRVVVSGVSAALLSAILGIGQSAVQPMTARAASPTVSFITGGAHQDFSLAVTSDGLTWFWGQANYPLGTVNKQDTTKPIVAPVPITASQATTAPGGAAALATDGTVWTWDANPNDSALRMAGISGVTQISGNPNALFMVKSDGTLWYWGCDFTAPSCNGFGATTPTQFTALTGVAQVAVGMEDMDYVIVRKVDGTVWAFGEDFYGELGDGVSNPSCPCAPRQVGLHDTLSGVTAVAAGGHFGMALAGGTVYMWGENNEGQMGRGFLDTTFPESDWAVPGLSGVTAIGGDSSDAYAVKSDGTLWGWGLDPDPSRSTCYCSSPVQVQGISGATAVSGGYAADFVLAGGAVWGWGGNTSGAVGNGTTSAPPAPVQLAFQRQGATACTAPVYCTTTVNLDNVPLQVTTPILPDPAFTASIPTDASQMAVSSTTTPFNELSIIAIPYGRGSPAEEELPTASSGLAPTYVADLQALRNQENGTSLPAPAATFFGQQVQAISNLVQINITPLVPTSPVAITEWVTDFGSRLWIFRLAQVTVNNPQYIVPVNLGGQMSVASDGPANPDGGSSQSSNGSTDNSPSSIPSPRWWNGSQCDDSWYYVRSGLHSKVFSQWNGLTACGPRPYGDGAPDESRQFTDQNGNAVGVAQLEWECVELSKRWLWLAYGVPARGANGSTMISAYNGAPGLTAVPDGHGIAPVPGDVTSWGASTGNGHTAVVTDSHVDPSTGNGYIMVIEQNFSTNGVARVAVNHFSVAPRSGSSNGWLHSGAVPAAGGSSSGTYPRPCQAGSSTTMYPGGPNPAGYWLVGADGGVFTIGQTLGFYGSEGGKQLNAAIVGITRTLDSGGYWLLGSDGGIFSHGDAHFYGSLGGQTLNSCIVGMVATSTGQGYWLVGSDGGVFTSNSQGQTFGDAVFYGSEGGTKLNAPIVSMAATPDNRGYWLLGADGGIFTFGDAGFYGSFANDGSTRPFVSLIPTHDGRGYWATNTNGQVYTAGDAQYYGGTGGDCNCVATIAVTPDGGGYYMLSGSGDIWAQGDAYNRAGWTADPPFVGMAVSA